MRGRICYEEKDYTDAGSGAFSYTSYMLCTYKGPTPPFRKKIITSEQRKENPKTS